MDPLFVLGFLLGLIFGLLIAWMVHTSRPQTCGRRVIIDESELEKLKVMAWRAGEYEDTFGMLPREVMED